MSQTRSSVHSPHREGVAIGRAAYLTHGRAEVIGDALDRMRAVAARAGVNFGRVGFLTSASGAELESGLEAAFAGRYQVFDLPTLVGDAGTGPLPGVNDIVLTSATPGRMAVIQWSVDGQSLGELGCDGVIAATPTGSTAYNLSAGGPVLVPGTDGYVVTFVSPHALNARSVVPGRPHTVVFSNAAADVPVQAIVDGHVVAVVDPGGRVEVRMGHTSAALARISGTSFFTRYLQEFSH